MITKALISEYVVLFEIWESSVKETHDFLDAKDFEAIKDLVVPEGFTMVDLYVYKSDPRTIEGFLGIKDYKIEMLFIKPDSIGRE